MQPRGVRFNNPFDISLPTRHGLEGGRIIGAAGQSGYGAWPTMEEGYAAGYRRMLDFVTHGHGGHVGDTITDLGKFYATDPQWPAAVARYSGLFQDEILHAEDESQMKSLAYGILMQEIGGVTGKKFVHDLVAQHDTMQKPGKPPEAPQPIGEFKVDPAIIAIIVQIGAPIAEAITKGILSAFASHGITPVQHPPVPATPPVPVNQEVMDFLKTLTEALNKKA